MRQGNKVALFSTLFSLYVRYKIDGKVTSVDECFDCLVGQVRGELGVHGRSGALPGRLVEGETVASVGVHARLEAYHARVDLR